MSWRLLWLPRSKRDLLVVGFETAADIGRAVTRWSRPPRVSRSCSTAT